MIFFSCWITLQFQEFQSAAIGKKIKIKIEPGSKLHYFHPSELFTLVIHYFLCGFLTQNMNQYLNIIIKSNFYFYKFYPYTAISKWFSYCYAKFSDIWIFVYWKQETQWHMSWKTSLDLFALFVPKTIPGSKQLFLDPPWSPIMLLVDWHHSSRRVM